MEICGAGTSPVTKIRAVPSSSTRQAAGGITSTSSECVTCSEVSVAESQRSSVTCYALLNEQCSFPGFTEEFFDAYYSVHPRSEPHHDQRIKLYELYHHLNVCRGRPTR